MHWLTLSGIIIFGVISSLRYHTICQNNNYNLPFNKKLFIHWGICLAVILPSVISFAFLSYYNFGINTVITLYFIIFAIVIAVLYSHYKTKLRFTNRATLSLILCNYLQIMIIVIMGLYITNVKILYILSISIFAFTPLFMKGIFALINPVFVKKNRKFIELSKEKLKRINPIKIGITGSYGKTSCKNILSYLLQAKYKVCATEKNYNTPLGIAITVDKMEESVQIFIAEMGARRSGDIAELCKLVEPDYGIITGVTNQHLETFKSIENIFEEKYNLAISLTDKSTCVFNGSDKYTLKMYKQYKGKKAIVKLNNFADLYANEIAIDSDGSRFTINYKEEHMVCQTKLLGRHNIQNILLCSALALELGISSGTLIDRIKTLPQVPHRLQLIRSNGMNILDDSYNANTLGIKYSLECLGYFDTRKVVLTQGIVELGKEQQSTNISIGRLIAEVADIVILCGINAQDIKKGLEVAKYTKTVYSYATLKEAQSNFNKILKKGDTLLIQNDLPDVI